MKNMGIGISPILKGGLYASSKYIVADGGVVTRDGDYLVHSFPTGTTLNFNVISNNGNYPVEYLLVAGGGAGGTTNNGGAGAGGGGGILTGSLIPSLGSNSISVGAGGVAQVIVSGGFGTSGADTTALGLTCTGGGGGGGGQAGGANSDGRSGGSAGGNGFNRTIVVATAVSGQGNVGGRAASNAGAGGGGKGSAGLDGGVAIGGNGGSGLQSSITGVATFYGAGGGGGSYINATGGLGGSSTGGNGGKGTTAGNYVAPTSPTANSGSGGGGAANPDGGATQRLGSNGADGIAIIRYYHPTPLTFYSYTEILTSV